MQIIECTECDLEAISELFNHYRVFYQQESNLAACREFIEKNLREKRSRIFLLKNGAGKAVAFSQLYPALCSVAMQPYYYLSDLYVHKSARRNGCAKHLMEFLTNHFALEGAQRLTLDTAADNTIARHLYESLGYAQEAVCVTYHRRLDRLK